MTIVFDNQQLLPATWRNAQTTATVRTFNPGLLRLPDGWLLAYRVVAEPACQRRIAVCRLDSAFRIIEGTQVPFSDWIRFETPGEYASEASTWFADPRLYRLCGRTFLYWNSGWHEPRNYQFLQEFDPSSLRPIRPPRELTLHGTRQKLEKNWTLFEPPPQLASPAAARLLSDGPGSGRVYAVYSVNPHRVLVLSVDGTGPIECVEIDAPVANPGGFAQHHGGLRGGAPPQFAEGAFYSFCHSIENGADGYEYVPSVYRFSADPPFRPTDMPRVPLPLAIPPHGRRSLPKLNPAVGRVIYPAGAAYAGDAWVISFGIDDERCGIAVVDHAEVIATLGR